jgi:GrpB-like predicted nucleotidyltransferase (UPF0157 family)
MLGQHKRNLNLVPYQSGWVELFEQEAALLSRALGEQALSIEHIGSTAIPGMAAKPIIDIMVAVASLAQATELIPSMEALGYIYKPHDTVPERLFFAKESSPEYRTHHLNLAAQESAFWNKQLAFRDYLREHEQITAEYVELKKRLAETYARTQILDREGKSEFVASVLELAKQEERSNQLDR